MSIQSESKISYNPTPIATVSTAYVLNKKSNPASSSEERLKKFFAQVEPLSSNITSNGRVSQSHNLTGSGSYLETKVNQVGNIQLKNTAVNLVNNYQNYLDKSKDYVMIIFFNLFGALLLISSFDLVSLYLSIELQSFALYILATFYKESRIITAAGLKYFLLGALSSCFILLGSALIYAFSGLTKFDSIYLLISSFDPSVSHTQFTFGLVLIFIGFLFKIGSAPLHN